MVPRRSPPPSSRPSADRERAERERPSSLNLPVRSSDRSGGEVKRARVDSEPPHRQLPPP
eukprot:CAMPEP_0174737548 /NCGR_PEP_ID=MMETSP1094-20130205/68483_1 /TAXON_ID=156173 /ORGANISM="Chrysochromulina brevifilum, Strain UTEX LB 985" /LENGTH=59 /DNA_ID=CAMNT_0015940791 /DNA_START=174 /DNA_END=349 /DNA_ORIENTATION=+